LQDRRAAEVLEQQAEEFAEKAVLDLGPRRQFVTELQQRLRRCWPPSVITGDLFVHDDVPAWLTPSLAEHDPDGDWQSTAEQLSASTATCNRRLAIARHQVEEALTKAAELTTKLNTQAALSRSLSPGLQMTPVRVQERLGQFDLACPQLESVPENLPERLRCAFRAIQPSWWRRLFSAG
jgi:hypothetical protein